MKQSLDLSNVEKRYGAVTALHATNMSVRAGEFLTLLGPSGSGKTTLLMMIAGFVTPSQGRLLLDGRDITGLPPERRNFGVVFQGYALFPHLTVRENIAFPLRARGIKGAAAGARVETALELTQLGHLGDRKPAQLSGGQQQRVALARALVFEPELLLLDEPLSALDKALRKDLQAELKDLHRRVGTTFVYVTHDQEEALSMSDRVAVLQNGRVQQMDTPRALYERPGTPFVASFIGKNNLLEGIVSETRPGAIRLRTSALETWVATEKSVAAGTAVQAALRPERIRVGSSPAPDTANQIQGRVAELTYLGPVAEIDIDVERHGERERLSAIMPSTLLDQPAIGAPIWIGWAAEDPVLIVSSAGAGQ